MIAGLIARVIASRWARAAVRCGLVITAVLLLLLLARRSGERTGRLLERIEAPMTFSAKMLEAPAHRPRDRGGLARWMRDGRF